MSEVTANERTKHICCAHPSDEPDLLLMMIFVETWLVPANEEPSMLYFSFREMASLTHDFCSNLRLLQTYERTKHAALCILKMNWISYPWLLRQHHWVTAKWKDQACCSHPLDELDPLPMIFVATLTRLLQIERTMYVCAALILQMMMCIYWYPTYPFYFILFFILLLWSVVQG